ncbi:TlpA family protein disulfide reductase [Fulvivirga lutea]|uniref:TlpA family protein disulfide reductase n=1 Tax=Fulvivirga lutea TaxID=2810512 RepID=A0A974WIS8_9BACT|nr:TlpA disulfide reductase family protein [Fulvivirga lutea]QSE98674.1 TlpA family protein disulfide reductase [Fulvivirga lutea]
MKRISILASLSILLFQIELRAQFQKDESGNPIITQEFTNIILDKDFEYVEGGSLNLKKYNDKIIVLDFWQTWCKPCLKGFEGLQKAKLEWPDKIEIIAVSPDLFDDQNQLIPIVDKIEQILEFMSKHDYPFEFVLGKELSKDLPIRVIPYKIVIGLGGNIIESKTGFGDGDKEYAYLKSLVDKYFR